MALIIREVYSSLFTGILIGTSIIFFYQGNSIFEALFKGLFSIADTYILESVSDKGHLSIIIFTMMIGAMVGLITKNGGMKGVVNILSRFARSPRSGQLVTWFLGVVIFFDDYANTLVVGNTMRPVCDRLKISREKLAYIVDSTAAPVAAIAFVTTWIGAELSYIQNGVNDIGLDENAYAIFFNSLAYSFYPVFTLFFILMLVIGKFDFGPMLKAERRARKGIIGDVHEKLNSEMISEEERESLQTNGKARWFNAVVPVLVIILGTFAGLLFTGWDQQIWDNPEIGLGKKISITIGKSDSYLALLWSSLSGVIIAVLLTLSQKILSLKESMESLIKGFKTMLTAVLILVLAWSLALVTEHMHTADFISHSMLKISLSPYFVPAITFILAALVSFSTGSSWGTMAILYPLLLPASWLISEQSGMDYNTSMLIFYNVVSSVLAGSVLGDHCSPISDTTILSSLASSCNHIEHVRTQLPYALTVGIIGIFVGTIPSAYGVSPYLLFPLGLIILTIVVFVFGKKNIQEKTEKI
jgi:Na+/H+ antiporter NhaC